MKNLLHSNLHTNIHSVIQNVKSKFLLVLFATVFVLSINSCSESTSPTQVEYTDVYVFNKGNFEGTIKPLHFYRTYIKDTVDKERRIKDYLNLFSKIEATLQINDKNINNSFTIKVTSRNENLYNFKSEFVVNSKVYKYNVNLYLVDPLLSNPSILMLNSDFEDDESADYFKEIDYTVTLKYKN